ncbi:MAG: hypothetical protein IV086_03505 [Hyphomonadaceae bacterium]|nr:MAG: hypothetical protein FD160_696 [Caulobacteraceae bacterium]MBT9444748.1 hypothetical protein [Hyphomonadaceae bacterium]TPW05963.1 MAG: hypothetical protein FD124_1931 [Alphaproteobacteria bacterium]
MRSLFMSLVAVLACAGTAAAQQAAPAPRSSPEVLAKVYACTALTEPQARLACFDAEVASLKSAESEGQFAAVDATRARQIQRESFGFSLPSLPQLGLPTFRRSSEEPGSDDGFDSQSMKIARLGRFDGRSSFVMENGQVWVLVDTSDNRLARPGVDVTIRKAALGSFLMSVEAGGRALRVRRAQ